jgi:indolepyruvate decarboxylase
METTVVQHVLSRLHDIGIKDVFGVAGDFAFPIDDAVSSNRNLRYLIERLLTKDGESYYNDLAQWHYHKLPEALGCDGWFTARVTTCGELDEAIKTAEARGTGAYIEVVTDKYAAAPLAKKFHESLETLYAA